MGIETKPFDELEYLTTDEDIAGYLTEALATGDAALISYALGVVARARGTSRIEQETGLSRESLSRALSAEGHPEFSTVLRILDAMGLRLIAEPISKAA